MIRLNCSNAKCKHKWDYKGAKTKFYVSCPRCLYKVKIPDKDEEGKK